MLHVLAGPLNYYRCIAYRNPSQDERVPFLFFLLRRKPGKNDKRKKNRKRLDHSGDG
jgi:hypothetical protein